MACGLTSGGLIVIYKTQQIVGKTFREKMINGIESNDGNSAFL